MQYCKKCGAEITKGARFCEKCGTPIEGGNSKAKKKWIIGCCVGIGVILATVTALYFTGVIGGKEKVVQTGGDVVPSPTEATTTPIPTEVAATATPEVGDNDDMEREAYEAYEMYAEEYFSDEYEDDYVYYAFIYLDHDWYPELMKYDGSTGYRMYSWYTYKDGEVHEIGGGIEYKPVVYQLRKGYIYGYGTNFDHDWWEAMYCLEDVTLKELYMAVEEEELGRAQLMKNLGIKDGEWREINYSETMDGAFTYFLGIN